MNIEMNRAFILMTESSFHPSYLINEWIQTFQDKPGYEGVIIRGERNEQQQIFHDSYLGMKHLSDAAKEQLINAYGEISESEMEMIQLYGIPNYNSRNKFVKNVGLDINDIQIKDWLINLSKIYDEIRIFIFLDTILHPWWIELTDGLIINAHSAVLPVARGMNAIENMAYLGDLEKFKSSVGATVHYIDNGIDTGPIINAVRIENSLSYDSLPQLKAMCYRLAFDLLIEQASKALLYPGKKQMGVSTSKDYLGPVFIRKDYSIKKYEQAKRNYLDMKNSLEVCNDLQ
ncbi:formyltransferase family protein [Chengkuizengella sp. SCS-71B]|uniref:formyltransferase family protein n=1 Tax=Chengkuizengella sp. SCS-71B TaxID=3115290 RepID=UPI0032C20F06